jgi:hypothetical protein
VGVVVPLHTGRPDANDWLVGRPGATLATLRGIRVCRRAGLDVHVDVVVTRPTAAYLVETAHLLVGLGVSSVRLARAEVSAYDQIQLMPRLGLVEPHLEAALRALSAIRVVVDGFPRCAHSRVHAVSGRITWVAPAGVVLPVVDDAVGRCGDCSDPCPGMARAYLDRFGWEELLSEGGVDPAGRPGGAGTGVVPVERDGVPAVRAGRAPATRVREALRQAVAVGLGGPLPDSPRRAPAARVRVELPGPGLDAGPNEPTPSRVLRRVLVAAAQEGAPTIRIAGANSLVHPDAPALLREATRLGFAHVEVAGNASGLAQWSDAEHRRLRKLSRLDAALLGADSASHDARAGEGAFAASLTGLSRLAQHAKVPVGAYAVLVDAGEAHAFARGWASGELPGEPCFRLAVAGGSLTELAAVASVLSGPAQTALSAVLPLDLRPVDAPLPAIAGPAYGAVAGWASGLDRSGSYRPCRCGRALCPGVAVGWRR